MAWETFDFSEYVPTHVDKLIPGNKYVSLSTSDTLFRDTRWIISADYIVNSEDYVFKYITSPRSQINLSGSLSSSHSHSLGITFGASGCLKCLLY